MCHDKGAILIVSAVFRFLQDFVICLIPVFLVRGLQMSKRQKIGLCGILGIGLITSVCGILSTYWTVRAYYCKVPNQLT